MPTLRQSPQAGRLGQAFPAVLAAAQADAPWAFRDLYDELAGAVTGYLRAHGAADPDGSANEVFLRAFTRIGGFEGDADRFRSWIFTIARHLLVDERRRSKRRVLEAPLTADHDGVQVSPAAEDDALAMLGELELRQLLAVLPRDQRDVLMLRIVADLTVPQIAAVLGKSVGAVKGLQRRGLLRLQRSMLGHAVPR